MPTLHHSPPGSGDSVGGRRPCPCVGHLQHTAATTSQRVALARCVDIKPDAGLPHGGQGAGGSKGGWGWRGASAGPAGLGIGNAKGVSCTQVRTNAEEEKTLSRGGHMRKLNSRAAACYVICTPSSGRSQMNAWSLMLLHMHSMHQHECSSLCAVSDYVTIGP
ncbi:hypothetical protein HaLaN_15651 [Haematococcus lacustris]|uniref:Uncharacterized protein n=1 Tax=Haematococcus lacustris TaxID=44745 RepID=A0A699Z9D2_HAELA|nr:hypothetical protein HaLaN_15651 [Haematococcus lacustris]